MTTQEQQNLARKLRQQAAALHAQGNALEKMAEKLEASCAPQKPADTKPDLRTAQQKAQIDAITPKPEQKQAKGWT